MATQAGSEHAEARTQSEPAHDGGTEPHGAAAHGRTAHATHHGNSVAAWTMVLIVMLGALVAAVGICIPSIAVIVVGAVIAVVGLVVGKLLSLAGYGTVKPTDPQVPHGVA